MTFEVQPATAARFTDVATMLAPKRQGAQACWCLSHRLPATEHTALRGAERRDRAEKICHSRPATGVLAYDTDGGGNVVVGWAGVAPREEVAAFTDHDRYPYVEGTWTVWCIKTRAGHRGRGIGTTLLQGAVDHARRNGAAVAEGFPVDTDGAKVDTTMAYVGVRLLFERAGFAYAGRTGSTSAGFPRLVMRREL
jgi:GNAT superfamily N-acetyltransferase